MDQMRKKVMKNLKTYLKFAAMAKHLLGLGYSVGIAR
jgi:hypothetical protein